MPAPMREKAGACSKTLTEKPARCSNPAAVRPPRPAPITAMLVARSMRSSDGACCWPRPSISLLQRRRQQSRDRKTVDDDELVTEQQCVAFEPYLIDVTADTEQLGHALHRGL